MLENTMNLLAQSCPKAVDVHGNASKEISQR